MGYRLSAVANPDHRPLKMPQVQHRNALQGGHQLLWYQIDRVLGQGSFGITYLAYDTNLDQAVAIKEYLPVELTMREGDDSVHPVSSDRADHFRTGLQDFIGEGRTLVRFDHPNIVRVHSVFEAVRVTGNKGHG